MEGTDVKVTNASAYALLGGIGLEGAIVQVKGINGQIALTEDSIVIGRKGIIALAGHGLKGDKSILISQISAVQFKKATFALNGYIQFAFVGGRESKSGLLGATKDEDSVMFNYWQAKAFEDLKARIDAKMRQSRQPVRAVSEADEIERLASLRDRGIITDEEFTAKKRKLLGLD
jgi:hypothetical protein